MCPVLEFSGRFSGYGPIIVPLDTEKAGTGLQGNVTPGFPTGI